MNDLTRRLDALGPRLRAVRQQQALSLAALAGATGISVSTLSRLESGKRRPTLELLLPLAAHYRMPLEELIAEPATTDPRIHRASFRRAGSTYLPLSRPGTGIQAFKQVIPPQDPNHVPQQQVHDGYEWLYVLAGRIRLLLGEQDLTLEAGEAAEFDTRMPHAVLNPGPGQAEVLNLFGPQGEQLHLRAQTVPRVAP